ncbi:MAG: flagellin [Blastocatellia bacterium]|jgi:flagellin|nr:flagellin [Blastocatellia bacterium]
MSFSLISNLGSLQSQSRLNVTGAKLNQAIQRLSSGLRVNNAGDDAAGLAIANKYRSDISVMSQGIRNANDGISTLQVIDGGLSTISSLLDRASTLAAQGASDTFTGNRDTLQAEFSKVISEITRQSQNIGLNSGGANVKSLNTVIGGGTDNFSAVGSNQGVVIDLSAGAVDAASLKVSTLSIGSSIGSVAGANAIGKLSAVETLTFKVTDALGGLAAHTVALASGDNGTNVVKKINDAAAAGGYDITASLDSTGKLSISSNSFFTASSSVAAAVAGTSTSISAAANDVVVNNSANHSTLVLTASTGNQQLSFTTGANGAISTFDVDTTNGATVAAFVTAFNSDSTMNGLGIYASASPTSGSVQFASKSSFQLMAGIEDDASSTGIAQGAATIVAGTASGGASGAKTALDAIKTAVASLGVVQGVVGAGQNRLQQAVDLATSQITNFQAAESRVRDADVAMEASNMSRLTVLQQAGVAALAQANQSSQAVLSLLR